MIQKSQNTQTQKLCHRVMTQPQKTNLYLWMILWKVQRNTSVTLVSNWCTEMHYLCCTRWMHVVYLWLSHRRLIIWVKNMRPSSHWTTTLPNRKRSSWNWSGFWHRGVACVGKWGIMYIRVKSSPWIFIFIPSSRSMVFACVSHHLALWSRFTLLKAILFSLWDLAMVHCTFKGLCIWIGSRTSPRQVSQQEAL